MIRGEPCSKIHTTVKNRDDLYFIALPLTIKNDMATDIHFPVATTNLATIPSLEGINGQLLKTIIEQGEVSVALLGSSAFLGIPANLN